MSLNKHQLNKQMDSIWVLKERAWKASGIDWNHDMIPSKSLHVTLFEDFEMNV
jgi:hypothetical protein